MNVRELIEHLQQFDPELPVKVRARPGELGVPKELYPPFLRASRGPGWIDHVLIESDPAFEDEDGIPL